jgi:hypothetical protein
MPLLKNTFQPFFPDPNSPAPLSCGTTFCNLVAAGDIPEQEWYQTPCAGNLVEDPEFEGQTLGAELVTNGSFTGSAAGWTLDAPWTYNSNAVSYGGLSPTPQVYQTGLGLVTGTIYQVSFTVTIGSGGIQASLGTGAGANYGGEYYASGAYTEYILFTDSNDQISFNPLAVGNVLILDNVSVKAVSFADWVTSGAWSLTNVDGVGIACKTDDTITGKLYNGNSAYIQNGDYYVATVTVTGYGGGNVSLYIDDGTGSTSTNIQAAITANDEYTYYITASQDGVIGFAPSAAFVGCLSNISIKRLRNDYPFQIIDQAGDSHDISDFVEYVEDKILLSLNLTSITGGFDFQCFTITVTDSCLISGDNILTDGEFDNQDFTEWVPNMSPYQYNYDGTGVEFVFEPLEGSNLVTNGDFASGTTGWTGFGADWAVVGGKAVHTPGNTTPLSQSITLGAIPALPDHLYTWWQLTISNATAGSVQVSIGGTLAAAYGNNDEIANFMQLVVSGSQTFSITPSSDFDGEIDLVRVHQTQVIWNNFPQLAHVPTTDLMDGNYAVDVELVSNITDGVSGVVTQLDYNNPVFIDRTTGTHTNQYVPYVATLKRLRMSGVFTHPLYGYYKLGRIKIDNVRLYAIEPFEATYTSECFNYKLTHSNTKLLTAYCDQDALGSDTPDPAGGFINDDLGFQTTGFRLQMRVLCMSYNASLDTEGNNAFFSNGNAAVKYAQFEKQWVFATDLMSEQALMTLGAMIHCDHFTVGDTGDPAIDEEYLATMETFTPQWREQGDYDLAQAIVTLRLKSGGRKFNRHR